MAEQYRVAATRLGLIAGKQKSTVVCMSSALMGEGKTSTVLNMAYVLSRDLNRKTVLVDCDLKRPTVRGLYRDGVECRVDRSIAWSQDS